METTSRYLLTFLLNSLWEVVAIACVAALASWVQRRSPASHRHVVWIAALIASVVLPVLSARSALDHDGRYTFSAPVPPELAMRPVAANVAPKIAHPRSSTTPARTFTYAQNTATTLVIGYLLLLLFRVLRLLRALIFTARIRRSATVVVESPFVRRVWLRCTEEFGLSNVLLLTSRRISTPVAAGILHPIIILPEALCSAGDEDVLATAIGHEMAHLARRDFGWNMVYQLLSLPIWFHPASALILRGIEETREMACDELVTERLLEPKVYARSLVGFATAALVHAERPGYLLGVFDGNILERRVRHLLLPPAIDLKRARLLLAGSLSGLVLCGVIASGVTISARAQSDAEVTSKLKALEPLMNQLSTNRDDVQLSNQVNLLLAEILSIQPDNPQALSGMVNLALWSDKPREAREWALKIVNAYPKERTSYYSLATTDWHIVYPAVMKARDAAGLRPNGPAFIPDPSVRRALREHYGSTVDEGMRMLETSLKMDPEYSDSMAYLNLLYRMKAFMAETVGESDAAMANAEKWVGKSLAAKRRNHDAPSPLGPPLPPPPPPPPPVR